MRTIPRGLFVLSSTVLHRPTGVGSSVAACTFGNRTGNEQSRRQREIMRRPRGVTNITFHYFRESGTLQFIAIGAILRSMADRPSSFNSTRIFSAGSGDLF